MLDRYGSDNGQGANWHPTRAFHMLRGEAISWILGLVLLETVREVQEQLSGRTQETLRKGTEWWEVVHCSVGCLLVSAGWTAMPCTVCLALE